MADDKIVTTLVLDKKTASLLDHLKDHYGASSRSAVLRKAIALLEIASEADEQKAKLQVVGNDSVREIVIR